MFNMGTFDVFYAGQCIAMVVAVDAPKIDVTSPMRRRLSPRTL